MLTREDVTVAYRLILGRLPESEETIQMQIQTNKDFARLRHSLLTSGEFLKKLQMDAALQGALAPAMEILNPARPNKKRQYGSGMFGFSSRK